MSPEELAYMLGTIAARNNEDYTLMSRRGLQPTGQPLSTGLGFQPVGAMRNMQMQRAMTPMPDFPSAPPRFASSDMSASFLDGPSTYSPGMEYGRGDSPRETLVQQALAQTAAPAKRVMQDPRPPSRPQEPAARPAQSASGRLFGGPDYQSMNALAEGPERGYTAPVMQSGRVNWGDPESAADFVRADRAMMAMREGRAEGGGIPEGMMGMRPMPAPDMLMGDMGGLPPPPPDMGMPAKKPAGQAGGRDAAIAKALDIIHELVLRGR